MTGIGPGFWAAVAASILSSAILGALALGRRTVRRELILPIQQLEAAFAKEKAKRRAFQKKIVRRMDRYERKASEERRLQIQERERVGSR